MRPLVVGTELEGRYKLERLLARGGMSEVWIARHRLLDRRVAIKFMRIAGDTARAHLLDEGRILASLRHPGIVEVFDCGLLDESTPYLVTELIDGESLRERLQRTGSLSAHDAVRLLLPVMRGAHAAHERGVVHRDVKPENILCERGDALRVKLIDFGISRWENGPSSPMDLSGTPAYMAPEQVRGERCDRRTDVWALGVTLYELLTASVPFNGRDVSETMALVLEGTVAFPRRARQLDGALWRSLMTALRVDPAQRFATVEQFALALEQWLASRDSTAPRPVAVTPPSGVPTPSTTATPSQLDALIREKLSDS